LRTVFAAGGERGSPGAEVLMVAHEPVAITSWEDLAFKVSEPDSRRVVWKPYGDLEFLILPVPVVALMASRFGVTFQCVDGELRHLSGDPRSGMTWVLRTVAHVD